MPARSERTERKKKAPRKAGPSRDPVKRFYAGLTIPCPIECGGPSHIIRVSTAASGAGEVWVECGSCMQRAQLVMPKATPKEKRAVEALLEENQEPVCARHADRTPLRNRGRQLVCTVCGVVYRG